MTTFLRSFWQILIGKDHVEPREIAIPTVERASTQTHPEILIDPGDPIIDYFQKTPNAVEVDKINMDSAALSELKSAGVKLVVPLISQGELIGLLNLGPRLSEQDYSTDDRKLLNDLATQASPAVRVAHHPANPASQRAARSRRLAHLGILPASQSGWR
jgi:hypothetical protein